MYVINMTAKTEFTTQNNSWVLDGVSTNYAMITQFVIIINRTGFPSKGDDWSVVHIKLQTVCSTPTANGINVRLYGTATELTVRKILISSANNKYLEGSTELQRPLINTLNMMFLCDRASF